MSPDSIAAGLWIQYKANFSVYGKCFIKEFKNLMRVSFNLQLYLDADVQTNLLELRDIFCTQRDSGVYFILNYNMTAQYLTVILS